MVLIGTAPAVWFQSFTILVLHLDFWVTLLSESKCPLCSKTKSVVTCTADHHMHRIWGPTAETVLHILSGHMPRLLFSQPIVDFTVCKSVSHLQFKIFQRLFLSKHFQFPPNNLIAVSQLFISA